MTPSATSADRSIVLRNVLVLQTYAVPIAEGFYYEIHLAPDTDSNAPRTVMLTRNVDAYTLALAAEGEACRMHATGHARQSKARRVIVLDTLEVA